LGAIDWILLALPVVLVIGCAIYTRRYIRSVADFVAGGRVAGRYLIANAKGEAASGVANTMSKFQPLLTAGFVLGWWDSLSAPVMMLLAISGFVVYRYRQTRAMTVGQFFEMRYSRAFRLFAGMLGFLAGILNYGVFPAIASSFFVYFLNLPEVSHFGAFHIQTKILVMAIYLGCSLWMMLVGGQITLLVTDCIEGILSHAIYLVIVAAIFTTISWSQMAHAMTQTQPGHSLVNPFDQEKTKDFNLMYIVLTLLLNVYQTMALQKDTSFTSSARSAHESRMGGVLGVWRTYARTVMLMVVAMAALTYMHQPAFLHGGGQTALDAIKDSATKDQMRVPIALRYLLPAGVKGLFCAMMVLGLMGGDAAHIMTWGTIFIQDVVMPFRNKPLEPAQHVLLLRLSVTFVAVFAFFYSIWFHQTQYIRMYWDITEAIFTTGAGVAIIGGLYWKKGTAWGAWSGFITGSTLAVEGILVPYSRWASRMPLNGTQMKAVSAASAVAVYVVISLLTCRQDHNMDRLLNRGKYAAETAPPLEESSAGQAPLLMRWIGKAISFNSEFTWADKIVSGGMLAWSLVWLVVVGAGTIWNLVHRWPQHVWVMYWLIVGVILPLVIAVATLVWFGIGGYLDLRYFFHRLATMRRNEADDGTVDPRAKLKPVYELPPEPQKSGRRD